MFSAGDTRLTWTTANKVWPNETASTLCKLRPPTFSTLNAESLSIGVSCLRRQTSIPLALGRSQRHLWWISLLHQRRQYGRERKDNQSRLYAGLRWSRKTGFRQAVNQELTGPEVGFTVLLLSCLEVLRSCVRKLIGQKKKATNNSRFLIK